MGCYFFPPNQERMLGRWSREAEGWISDIKEISATTEEEHPLHVWERTQGRWMLYHHWGRPSARGWWVVALVWRKGACCTKEKRWGRQEGRRRGRGMSESWREGQAGSSESCRALQAALDWGAAVVTPPQIPSEACIWALFPGITLSAWPPQTSADLSPCLNPWLGLQV